MKINTVKSFLVSHIIYTILIYHTNGDDEMGEQENENGDGSTIFLFCMFVAVLIVVVVMATGGIGA